jgi:hypothetical protein
VLLAHALAHSLFQHGLEPAAYPAFKLLADVADLRRFAGEAAGRRPSLVSAEVNGDDARPPGRSRRSSRSGAAVFEAPKAEARLLAHLVRGALEPG